MVVCVVVVVVVMICSNGGSHFACDRMVKHYIL